MQEKVIFTVPKFDQVNLVQRGMDAVVAEAAAIAASGHDRVEPDPRRVDA